MVEHEARTANEDAGTRYAGAAWPRTAQSPCGETRIVLTDTSWEIYETLDRSLENVPGVRLTYFDGLLEIMSPISRFHEARKGALSGIVQAFCFHHQIPFYFFGSASLGEEADDTGGEPDESFAFGSEKKIPDLVIEINLTSGGLDKLPRYQRLGVPEVWIWRRDQLHVFVLDDGGYTETSESRALPGIDLQKVSDCARIPSTSEAILAFRASLENP